MNREVSTRRNRRLTLLALLVVALGLVAWKPNTILGFVTRPFGLSVDVGVGGPTTLTVPEGFQASVFAQGLQGPRLMAVGPDGTVYVAEQSGGRVTALPDANGDGKADGQVVVADGLNGPNSVAVYSGTLIVGEHSQVSQLVLGTDHKATSRRVLVPDLPADGVHLTKTALVGADGRLYVAIGSSCNVCIEGDQRRAAVSVYSLDGGTGRVFSRGLRNAVGLALNPWNGEIWASVNGRDLMGDDTPPETVYALADGADFGFPRCHAGDIVDPDFGKPTGCVGVTAPILKMQAHMAPLGITFYKDGSFPEQYRSSLFIAMHGSWNRSSKVGYKVMRVPLKEGRVAGDAVDFATGFLKDDGSVSGRPAGVAVAADGSLLVSDDKSGLIYRIAWQGKP